MIAHDPSLDIRAAGPAQNINLADLAGDIPNVGLD